MHRSSFLFGLLASCAVASSVAAGDSTVTPGNQLAAPPEAWLGATPHLVVMGTINGRTFDLQMPDMAAAAGVAAFEGKREYLPAEGGAWLYGDFEVALKATLDGVEKALELEFENLDFAAHSLPATFVLQQANFPAGLNAFLEAQMEWETSEATVNDEIGGWDGMLTLAVDEGTPDEMGLVPDGTIGGHVVATRGDDRVVISFTVPVAGYELED